MAATMINKPRSTLAQYLTILCSITLCRQYEATFYNFSPSDVLSAFENACLLLVDKHADEHLMGKFAKLQDIFANEGSVLIGTADLRQFQWPSGDELYYKVTDIPIKFRTKQIAFFSKKVIDRACLYHPNRLLDPKAEHFEGPIEVETMVQFLNAKCNTFLDPSGRISLAGMHREDILSNLFTTSDVSDVTIGQLYSTYDYPLNGTIEQRQLVEKEANEKCSKVDCEEPSENRYTEPKLEVSTCDRIELPLRNDDFFTEYVQRSRPVIISGAAKHWDAFSKWTNDYLREKYGNETVHIKLTPGGDFEGVEPINLWENYEEFSIPKQVSDSLKYPDLVVVRPARVNMKFDKFLDLITWAADQESRNVSAYLEYSSIPDYMPDLEKDLEEFPFISKLKLKHLNMWLSDGNTLGRLHFDPYDNLLCQVSSLMY